MNPLESSGFTIASNPNQPYPSQYICLYVQAKHTYTHAYINIDMCVNKDINKKVTSQFIS